MKITSIAVVLVAALFVSATSFAGEADLLLKQIVRRSPEVQTSWSKAIDTSSGRTLIPCFIKSRDAAATSAAVEAAGGRAAVIGGEIISAHIPVEFVDSIVARSEVDIVEAAMPLGKKMNTARYYSSVDVVQDGSALGTAYNGTNVIVGVVDDSLDYGNDDFKGTSGLTRIQYLMQQTSSGNIECTKRTIADGSCAITDGGQGAVHGTNVTGIAAGANSAYTGVAPKSDIMFVFINATDADTGGSFATAALEGVSTIFTKADTMDKAAVINMSLGTSIGAHDGTSLLEEGITTLTTAKAGRILVNAAGNEQAVPADFAAGTRDYIGGIHASIDVAAGTGEASRIMVISGTGAMSSFTSGTLVDVWLGTGQKDNCSIAILGYTHGRSTNNFAFPGLASTTDVSLASSDVPFGTSTTTPVSATGNDVTVLMTVDSSDARNSKPHAQLLIEPSNGTSTSALESMWFDVVIRASAGGTCSGNMWIYYDVAAYHDFLKNVADGTHDVAAGTNGAAYTLANGDSFYTTTIPATAVGAIAAGSFMPPKPVGAASSTWTADNGTTYDQSSLSAPGGSGSVTSDLSSFSSLGPTADGRTKPDVVAPGEPIISTKPTNVSVSSSLTVGGSHFKEAGTSMSSPHVAGIVALLLERNNTLGVSAVRTALATSASTTGMTSKTTDPANSFGAGKVSASAVLASVGADTSAYHGNGDLDPPDSGSSSCAMISSRNMSNVGGYVMISLSTCSVAILLIKVRRRRQIRIRS